VSLPGTEARLAAQEELTTLLHAQIKQLSLNMQQGFMDVKQEIQKSTSFEEVDAYLKQVATKEDLKVLATKEDVSKLETRFDKLEATLQAILERLPKQE
jgi:hypothetical protein